MANSHDLWAIIMLSTMTQGDEDAKKKRAQWTSVWARLQIPAGLTQPSQPDLIGRGILGFLVHTGKLHLPRGIDITAPFDVQVDTVASTWS